MADRQWYTAIDGQQAGPYSDQQLRDLIAAGNVRADTFVWCAGMSDWAAAGDVPGLIPRSRPAPPPQPPRPAPQAARSTASSQTARPSGPSQNTSAAGAGQNARAAGPSQNARAAPRSSVAQAMPAPTYGEPFKTHVPMWPLLGRALLVVIGQIFVIPAPWTTTSFYRWFVEHTEAPGQQPVAFVGKPTDIWYIFMLNAACAYLGSVNHYLQLATFLLTPFFLLLIMQWFWRCLVWEGQTAPLTFTGDYWRMLGWYVLTLVSFITIVGWAWAAAAWTRWICRHVEGAERQLIFTASGWDLLWRSWLFFLSCMVIVPIPWTLHWYTRWLVSQFALSSAQA